MAEYWKSTPKYWCKFCSIYIKDTKFERQQHEATGRHQGNIQRSLRGLHREQETEQRNKARAQAEVARLNGLVPSASGAASSVATGSGGPPPTYQKQPEKKATLEDRKKQWEQLAAMGIAIPDEARADLGMLGEWKPVEEEFTGERDENGELKALNKGVRKRKIDEEEAEQQAAGETITRRKGWGQTFKSFPGSKGLDDDDDLDSLLGKKKTKPERSSEEELNKDPVKKEEPKEEEGSAALQDIPTAEEAEARAASIQEEKTDDVPKVTFKKRKKIAK